MSETAHSPDTRKEATMILKITIALVVLLVVLLVARWAIKSNQFDAIVGVDPPSLLQSARYNMLVAEAARNRLRVLASRGGTRDEKRAKKLRDLMEYFKISLE